MICTNSIEGIVKTNDNDYYIIPENHNETEQQDSVLKTLTDQNITAFYSLVMINNSIVQVIRVKCGLLQFLVIISLIKQNYKFEMNCNVT